MKKIMMLCFILLMSNALLHFSKTDEHYVAEERHAYNDFIDMDDTINDCGGCISAASESCTEINEKCLSTDDCADWFDCAKDCHQLGTADCHDDCDDDFFEDDTILIDVKSCLCEVCSFECETICESP